MQVFEFRTGIWLPNPLAEVFPFFSEARNLEVLTPPWLRFEVLTRGPLDMAKGLKVDYKLRLRGLPVRWRSEITRWEPPSLFVDEQRRGPYRLWVHEHRFREESGMTLAEDFVRYAVPGGWLVDRLFVGRDIRKIFDYRHGRLRGIFGTPADADDSRSR